MFVAAIRFGTFILRKPTSWAVASNINVKCFSLSQHIPNIFTTFSRRRI